MKNDDEDVKESGMKKERISKQMREKKVGHNREKWKMIKTNYNTRRIITNKITKDQRERAMLKNLKKII